MNNKMYKLMNWPEIEAVVYAESDDPAKILGPHAAGSSTLYQTFVPGAAEVRLRIPDSDKAIKMEQVDEAGFYAALVPGKPAKDYVYVAEYAGSVMRKIPDAYRFGPQIKEKDLKKFTAGEMNNAYEILGAHITCIDGTDGVRFAIWAPNARRVSVIGEFNNWDGRVHQMKRHGEYGVFELFIPQIGAGEKYLFEVDMKGGLSKSVLDPYAAGAVRDDDGFKSVVTERGAYAWNDKQYMADRKKDSCHDGVPVSIYECDPASYAAEGITDYRKMGAEIASHAAEMGYTHVELKPIAEYASEESCGYETIQYYAPTSRYGSADDFAAMIDELHGKGLRVILDWTLAHPSSSEGVLRKIDGTSCYVHADPRQGIHPQWGTLLFNYGRGEVVSFLRSNAEYWIKEFHIDGLRIDSLASVLCLDYGRNNGEWVANMYGGHENLEAVDFIKKLNSDLSREYPGVITVAEDSSAWPRVTASVEDGGLGFTYKWNIGWRDDFIRYIAKDPIYRSGSHNDLTLSMLYCYSDRFILPMSSDCGDLMALMPGDDKAKAAGVRMSLAYMMMHPGCKLISGFYDSYKSPKDGIAKIVKALNKFYVKNTALYELDEDEQGFEWINSMDASRSTLSFIRKGRRERDFLVIAANFAGAAQDINVGVTLPGKYTRIFNTDASVYGGSSTAKEKAVYSIDGDIDARPYYIPVSLPALSVSVYAYEPFDENDREYMLKLTQEAKAKANEAIARAKKEEAKALAAEKKAAAEAEKAEEAAKAAEEARIRAEKERAKAIEEMEKAREAAEVAREAAKSAELASHRLEVTEKSMKLDGALSKDYIS